MFLHSVDFLNRSLKILSEFDELYRENPCLWKIKSPQYKD